MMTAILTNIEQILIERNDEIAGFILEPLIQGAIGLFVHPKGFFERSREIVQKIRCLINL